MEICARCKIDGSVEAIPRRRIGEHDTIQGIFRVDELSNQRYTRTNKIYLFSAV